MNRKKFDIIDVIVAFALGIICGAFLWGEGRNSLRNEPVARREAKYERQASTPSSPQISFSSPSSSSGAGNNALAPEVILGNLEWTLKDVVNVRKQKLSQNLIKQDKITVTAYCPKSCCCGEFADGITASGHIIQEGDRFVAAPPHIPFGTRLSIPGYAGDRMVSVEDRGGAIQGNKLDVFFGGENGHQEAIVWGVKTFEIGD